jgi:hypothetical protein
MYKYKHGHLPTMLQPALQPAPPSMDGITISSAKALYAYASNELQLHSLPSQLPCREIELNAVNYFLTQSIMNQGSTTSLYISGMPGTGKTATGLEVIRRLTLKAQQGYSAAFSAYSY